MIKFALSFYSLLDLSLKDIIATIKHADKIGLHYAVLGQSAVRDAFIGLAQVATETKDILLGTNIVPIYTRTPTDLAMSVITLNEAVGFAGSGVVKGRTALSTSWPLSGQYAFSRTTRVEIA